MKRMQLLFLISSLGIISLFSQVVSYEKGLIVTKNNDTIKALIELVPTYQGYVHYKINQNEKIQSIKIKDIRLLKTPFNLFRNILYKKEELLFRTVVEGNIQLFEYSKINKGPSSSAYGGTMTYYGPPIIIYAIRTSEKDTFIKQKKDVDMILPLLENCQEAKAIVTNKAFKLEDLKSVVIKLNSCK